MSVSHPRARVVTNSLAMQLDHRSRLTPQRQPLKVRSSEVSERKNGAQVKENQNARKNITFSLKVHSKTYEQFSQYRMNIYVQQ